MVPPSPFQDTRPGRGCFYPEKADCLNDGKHDYEATITCPKNATRMRCTMCDDERQPTEDEWKVILPEKD